MDLRAVVIGAGFAGEGHTFALRANGVSVEAMCARTPDVVEATARRLRIPRASVDWRQTLREVRPEIVSIAIPAAAHVEIATAAIEQGCHVLCDKPLAVDALDAQRMYASAVQANVKHAYAATHRYDPTVVWLEELVRNGVIGEVGEIEATFRRHVPPLTPWTWYDSLELGGGHLANALPHWLGILERVLGGEVQAAAGEARASRDRAPFVPAMHDFRTRGARRPTREQAASLEWRACDADGAFTALLRFPTSSSSNGAQASISVTGLPAPWPPNGFRFFGTKGTLLADGHFSYSVSLRLVTDPYADSPVDQWERLADGSWVWHPNRGKDTDSSAGQWEQLPVPERILAKYPSEGDDFQRKWTCIARDFVADIRGEQHDPYPTFRDGWRYQLVCDAVRRGAGWQAIASRG